MVAFSRAYCRKGRYPDRFGLHFHDEETAESLHDDLQIYSAASDATSEHSCRLWMYAGTSMACPITAGAAAMVSLPSRPLQVARVVVVPMGQCLEFSRADWYSWSSPGVLWRLVELPDFDQL